MPDPTILIVGAGIGGLSTGCYAQMNGYRTRILEMHGEPGGLCTAWSRNGYTFDGCIHNLAGTSPQSPFHRMWKELGVVPAIRMRAYPELVSVERRGGEPLTVFADPERLRQHMRQLSPADGAVIDQLVEGIYRFRSFDMLAFAMTSPWERIKALTAAPLLVKYGRVTLDQFAQRFSNPFLRRAFPTILYDWPGQSMAVLLSFLAGLSKGDLGWAVGGSKSFAQAIERRFLELGGEIRYRARVQSILVENDRAVGVRLTDGSEERADIVVSNANGHTTIFDMLGGRYTSSAIRAYYGAPEDRCEMGIHVSLGIARNLSHESHAIVLPLDQPVEIANEMRDRLYVEPFGFDPTLAPPGKSALKVVMATSYRYWEDLSRTPERYTQEKQHIADRVIGLLERRFPGLRHQVEVVDVATPMTTLRFTGNGHGFRMPMARMMLTLLTGRRLSQTLPGLGNFYMVGQWAGVPGVPVVAAMGRDVARAICRRDGRPFLTTVASVRETAPDQVAASVR